MRLNILFLVLLSGLLLSAASPAQAARKKSRAVPKAADISSEEIPPFNWSLMATGYVELFRERNREVESTEPNRFYPASVAFALGKIDAGGHFLMLKCYSDSDNCGTKRDSLEDRMIYTTLLEIVRTKAPKDQLYNVRTWDLTPLGEKHLDILRKRYPDLPARLGRLVGAAFSRKS